MRALCLVMSIALAGAAHAQPEPVEEQARRLSDEGLVHFNQGRYREAIKSFNESFELHPLPLLLFNIAQAYRLAGECAAARDTYRRYLDENPRAANRKLAEAFLLDMEKCASAKVPMAMATPPAPTEPAPEPEPRASPAAVSVVSAPQPTAPPPHKPLVRQWWLWTTVGVVVAGVALGLGVGLSQPGQPPSPSLGTVTWH